MRILIIILILLLSGCMSLDSKCSNYDYQTDINNTFEYNNVDCLININFLIVLILTNKEFMTKELWKCNACSWKSLEEPPFEEKPCGCCSDFVCPDCGSGQIENEFVSMNPNSEIAVIIKGMNDVEYTFKYENLALLINDGLDILGDKELLEIRDSLLISCNILNPGK